MRGSASRMLRSSMRTQTNSYTAYGIGCAGVWGVILLLGRRRLDSQTWNTLRLVCGGWWMGWTSATIARVGYPPPAAHACGREEAPHHFDCPGRAWPWQCLPHVGRRQAIAGKHELSW